MIFNSYTFIAFFIIMLILHNCPFPWKVKKVNLLIASYIFYAAWNPPFVLLLWLATVVDWYMAQAIYRATDAKRKKIFLLVSLVTNLGLLGYFKYGGFLLHNLEALLRPLGIVYRAAGADIVLPIG